MTNEQKNQVAAMCNEGMSIDEIVAATKIPETDVRDFVKSRNARKKGCITKATQQAVLNWYKMGNSEGKTATHFGLAQSTVHKIIVAAKEGAAKEKEPTAAATATDSKVKTLQVQDNTFSTESQALRGVEVIGLMQTMLIGIEENFGDNVEIMSLRADSEQAHIMFRYGGEAYALSFGLAF